MFKGIYTIEKKKATLVNGTWVAGDTVEVIEEENTVSPETLFRFHRGDTTATANLQVFIHEMDMSGIKQAMILSTSAALYWVQGTITTGGTYVPAAGATDPYWYCVTTFNPGASTRNIRTLGVAEQTRSDFQNPQSSFMTLSILSLNTPCVQTTSEILQITYRIFYDRTAALANTNLQDYMLDAYARRMINTGGVYFYMPDEGNCFSAQKMEDVQGAFLIGAYSKINQLPTSASSSLYTDGWTIVDSLNGVGQNIYRGRYGQDNNSTTPDYLIGAPIRSWGWGYLTSQLVAPVTWANANKGTLSSVQNIFPKAVYTSGQRTPFLTVNEISLSPAKVNITDTSGTWLTQTEDPVTPYVYRINITAAGLAGVATYKLQRKRTYYPFRNTWAAQQGIGIPTLPGYNGSAGSTSVTIDGSTSVRHGFVVNTASSVNSAQQPLQHSLRNGIAVQKYFYPQFIGFDADGITIADVNAKWVNFDSTTTPALNATDILQVETDGTTILVACANTGLWKIIRPWDDWTGASTTITQVTPTGITNPNSCRGVTTKNIGAITGFRIINGGTGYTIGDTVTIDVENSVGSGFTGTVASVNSGAITGVTITNAGSGYLEDNVRVRVANGTGAKLEPLVGANGIWWAVFNDTTDNKCILAQTTNAGSTWTLYDETTATQFRLTNYTSGSPGPTNIIGIHIDPYHADDRFLIQAPTTVNISTAATGTSGEFFWWSRAGSNPTSNQVRTNNTTTAYSLGEKRIGSLKTAVLNNTNQWITTGVAHDDGAVWTWGNASATATNLTGTIVAGAPTVSRARTGNDVVPTFVSNTTFTVVYRDSTQLNTGSYTSALLGDARAGSGSTQGNEYGSSINFDYNLPLMQYIGKGTYLCWSSAINSNTPAVNNTGWWAWTGNGDGTNTSQALLPYGHWENYGWNGTEWQLGHAGSKTTHSGSEALIDGLNISFNDNAGVDSYILNEYYDAFLFDGILNDNATYFDTTHRVYFGASERGTTFTPGTVPAADVGAVVDEPFTVLQEYNNLIYTEPGYVIHRFGATSTNLIVGEQELTGDFEFKFKVPPPSTSTIALDIGIMTWANVVAGARTTAAMLQNMRIVYNFTSNTLTNYTIQCRNTQDGTIQQTVTVTDGAPGDVFSIQRVGTDIFFKRNGVSFRTAVTGSSNALAICMIQSSTNSVQHIYDATISYTINRRYVDVGNGTTTGRAGANFGRLNVGTDGVGGEFAVSLDGVPATLLTNGYTAPAAGQVNWLRGRGTLWLNSADVGKAITGKWNVALKQNFT